MPKQFRAAIRCGWAVVALTVAGVDAHAQNEANGELIAKTWCAGCHRVEAGAPRIGGDGAPSFSSVAQMSGTTKASLELFLSAPHARMPDYNLTRNEIRDVSAYILSLRK